MLLIDNDQPQLLHGREHRGTRANDNAGTVLPDLLPFIVAFAGGEMAVKDGHGSPQRTMIEAGLEPFDRLRRERNLRHQHDGAPAQFEATRDGLQIHLGLAASRDTVKQEHQGRPGRSPTSCNGSSL